ncbi:MAG TPA: hypothetical protein VME24_06030 [Alphaproteobacteria bacterium]|nr:hypothetical protein [Alphaproteobacteria bacterium]
MKNASLPAPESLERKHEVSEKRVRNVLIVGAGAAFLLVFSLAACALTFYLLAQGRPTQWMPPLGIVSAANLKPLERFPAPYLTVDDDHAQRIALYSAQNQRLNSYGWEDRSNGIVHIPIDRAMDLILQSGLPTRTNGISGTDGSPLQLIQKIQEYK